MYIYIYIHCTERWSNQQCHWNFCLKKTHQHSERVGSKTPTWNIIIAAFTSQEVSKPRIFEWGHGSHLHLLIQSHQIAWKQHALVISPKKHVRYVRDKQIEPSQQNRIKFTSIHYAIGWTPHNLMCQNWMVSKNTSQCFWRAGMLMLLMPSCRRPLFVLHSERSCNPEMGNRKSELQSVEKKQVVSSESGTAWDLATANNAFHNHLAHQSREWIHVNALWWKCGRIARYSTEIHASPSDFCTL